MITISGDVRYLGSMDYKKCARNPEKVSQWNQQHTGPTMLEQIKFSLKMVQFVQFTVDLFLYN